MKQKFIEFINRLFGILSRLFDILSIDVLSCKCQIKSCAGVGCSLDCFRKVRIDCSCSKENIPVKELLYIKGPREEVGKMGPHQMGLADIPESRRQVVAIKRQEERRKAGERSKRKLEESEEGRGDKEDGDLLKDDRIDKIQLREN